MMAHIHRFNRLAAPVAPLVNWLQQRRPLRWLLEKTAGIDRRRSLPELHRDHFRKWFARHQPPAQAGLKGRVLLLDDCFTTYNKPQVGRAAVRLLEAAGYRVETAGLTCCGRAMISKGFLRQARDLVQAQLPGLARRVADGTPLLGLEPSCLLTLVDEWPDLVPGSDARRVAGAATLMDGWLVQNAGKDLSFNPLPGRVLFHGHCNQKALVGTAGTVAALRLVPELDVGLLDSGCCGMAGSFGFEKAHFDVSRKVAELVLLPALQAEPEALVAAPGNSCRHQIRDLAGRQARHPLEILADQDWLPEDIICRP